MKKKLLLAFSFLSFFSCKKSLQKIPLQDESKTVVIAPSRAIEVNGLSFVAPPEVFPQNPMPAVKDIGAGWIAVIPYGFTMPKEARVHYNEKKNWQWYGESPDGIKETIRLAHEAGVKVMFKPQVYCPDSWTGYIDFEKEEQWQSWEADYEKYIMTFVEMAQNQNVELFCIGTEFRQSATKREKFWRELIKKIKTKYNGKLTYASNWDEYPVVPFWDELDYVGINAYFPLNNSKTPNIDTLNRAWQPIVKNIDDFYKKIKKPILFTEYGYLSVDNCAYQGWELEKKIKNIDINEQAQANALEALLFTFSQKEYWKGGFLWKWFPNMRGHEGYPERDYTPQGKISESVMRKYYSHK